MAPVEVGVGRPDGDGIAAHRANQRRLLYGRTERDPVQMAAKLAITRLDPSLPINNMRTLKALGIAGVARRSAGRAGTLQRPRVGGARRTREIGFARRSVVSDTIFCDSCAQGAWFTIIGAAIGITFALIATQSIASLLDGVPPVTR